MGKETTLDRCFLMGTADGQGKNEVQRATSKKQSTCNHVNLPRLALSTFDTTFSSFGGLDGFTVSSQFSLFSIFSSFLSLSNLLS